MSRPETAARPDPAPGPMLAALLTDGAFDDDDDAFTLRIQTLRGELAPATALEAILVALIVEAAERLRHAHRRRDEIEAGDKNWSRYRNMAERSFWKALTSLQRGRRPVGRRPAAPPGGPAAPEAPPEPKPAPSPPPPIPPRPRDERRPHASPRPTSPGARPSKVNHLLNLMNSPRPALVAAPATDRPSVRSAATPAPGPSVLVGPAEPDGR